MKLNVPKFCWKGTPYYQKALIDFLNIRYKDVQYFNFGFFSCLFSSFFSTLLLSISFALHILSACCKKVGVNYGQSLEPGKVQKRDLDHFNYGCQFSQFDITKVYKRTSYLPVSSTTNKIFLGTLRGVDFFKKQWNSLAVSFSSSNNIAKIKLTYLLCAFSYRKPSCSTTSFVFLYFCGSSSGLLNLNGSLSGVCFEQSIELRNWKSTNTYTRAGTRNLQKRSVIAKARQVFHFPDKCKQYCYICGNTFAELHLCLFNLLNVQVSRWCVVSVMWRS